ncbi:hypothetical protein GCM10022225_29920 [Plantactinospora mayteni]|uniref:Uncharacterized protein n=1 Tax=Plantactinospora mayteni TaxID=566021 RepID=A0ABQ4EVD3_9ACTN|nr:hypothetical protein Pma05_52010 [Plantactinospora mayteni]
MPVDLARPRPVDLARLRPVGSPRPVGRCRVGHPIHSVPPAGCRSGSAGYAPAYHNPIDTLPEAVTPPDGVERGRHSAPDSSRHDIPATDAG